MAYPWPLNEKKNDYMYIDNFKSYIRQNPNKCDVYVMFDRYMEFSTMSVARSGRQSCLKGVDLTGDMYVPPHNVILDVTDNKH